MKVVLAGGSGALGRRIAADFEERGADVVVLTRSPKPGLPFRQVRWDGCDVGAWASELSGAVLINLAGEIVDRPPTRENIQLLTSSRVRPTTALRGAAAESEVPPRLWLQASTAAIYGDRGDEELTEASELGDGPPQMVGVASAWEQAARDVRADRQVVLRTGVVLDRETPALERLLGLVRWGLGGRVGSGRQWVSWLHIEDFLAAVRFLVDSELSGVVNLSSPEPVRNAELMATLRAAVGRPTAPPTPSLLVRWCAPVLRTDPNLALLGRRCLPARLLDAGFEFRYPCLRDAVADLV